MSAHMTEEEQLESIKQWWKNYGNYIMLSLSAILLVIAGARYWNWHQAKVTMQASMAYEQMMISYTEQKPEATASYANQLIKAYSRTSYADAARLLLAKREVEQNEYKKARAHLNAVAQKSSMPALQEIARARLARLLMVDQQYEEALQTLNQVADKAYLPLINELKGDIYTAKGETDKALRFYSEAKKEGNEKNPGNLFLEMKSNELAAMHQASSTQRDSPQTV